jgi:endonuclease/exonuclease/phosphatase family metal-dependent hydrolase
MTVEMISRRLALFISSIALLGTLAFSVPAARFFTSSPPEKKTLRVMTYNIHVGVGMDKKLDLQRIAEVINAEHPDLVGLQEVDRGVKRTEGKDEIAELAKLTAMKYAFAHNLDYQGGQYGVAILSRFPVKQSDHRKYQNRREAERRGMIRVEIEFAGRTLNFVTTHLDYQFEDGRVFETEQLLKFLEGINGPLIVVGDFNEEPQGNAYKLILTGFEDAWIVAKMKEQGLSYPADRPVKRIDYIFTRRSDRLRVKRPRIISTAASDHLPLVADIQIR